MPRIDERTIADQIHEYLAPVQPEDCRKANLDLLATAMKASGPVIHRGHIVTLKADGSIDFDGTKPFTPAPATKHTDKDGTVTEIPAPEPTDEDYAKQWALPVARSLPLSPPTQPVPAAQHTDPTAKV